MYVSTRKAGLGAIIPDNQQRHQVSGCQNLCFICSQVQSSIGHSDYVRRDTALAALIQPLAGEYGMHNDQPQGGFAACARLLLALQNLVSWSQQDTPSTDGGLTVGFPVAWSPVSGCTLV